MNKKVVEFKNKKVIIDGVEKKFEEIGLINNNTLDLRMCIPEELFTLGDTIFINRSIRNINIVGLNDWNCILKNRQKISASKGIMPYMSQEAL